MFSSKNKLISKQELMTIMKSDKVKELFLQYNITNVILFGSITTDSFNCESDVDIAVISKEKLAFTKELKLVQQLENLLNREVDLIDINDSNVNNMVKISALNSSNVIIHDNLLEENINYFDNLCRENEEFWGILDRVVMNLE